MHFWCLFVTVQERDWNVETDKVHFTIVLHISMEAIYSVFYMTFRMPWVNSLAMFRVERQIRWPRLEEGWQNCSKGGQKQSSYWRKICHFFYGNYHLSFIVSTCSCGSADLVKYWLKEPLFPKRYHSRCYYSESNICYIYIFFSGYRNGDCCSTFQWTVYPQPSVLSQGPRPILWSHEVAQRSWPDGLPGTLPGACGITLYDQGLCLRTCKS